MKPSKDASTSKPKSIDEYLAQTPEPARSMLASIRKTVRAAAPKATELISYGVPAFKLDGLLVAFGRRGHGASFYVMSASLLSDLAEELTGYGTSKGTIRFDVDNPPPPALIRRIVKERLSENAALARLKRK